jgi:hypothetical protein
VAYYLGLPENRLAADQIRGLPSELQPYELGKLETQIMMARKTKKVSTTPEPITPVGMSSGGAQEDPSKMTTAEWMAWDRKRTMDKLKEKLERGG